MSSQNHSRFRLLQACPPALENGRYTLHAQQKVTVPPKNGGGQPDKDTFSAETPLEIGGAHFALSTDEVHSLYPPANASGNYSNSMGHITLKKKTLPWENKLSPAVSKSEAPTPWLALISLADGEETAVTEMTVGELLKTTAGDPTVYYPLTKLAACTEGPEDLCRALDLTPAMFGAVMPREEELSLLAHAKAVDMSDKCDELVSLDGYFSVLVSNRFIPSGTDKAQKSTLHLVSLEGYAGHLPGGADFPKLQSYRRLRLVSLYSWSVYSQSNADAEFREIIKNILCGPFAAEGHPLLQRGHVPLKHVARTGETTVSLYRGPLVPYRAEKSPPSDKDTADGRIVYDGKNGVFDMSYAAAWQLGRLLALKNKTIALEILRWRRNASRLAHSRSVQRTVRGKLASLGGNGKGDIVEFWVRELGREVAENGLIAPVSPDPKRMEEGR